MEILWLLDYGNVNQVPQQQPNLEDAMTINAVCKPHGINLRVSMPDLAESRFVEGQIEASAYGPKRGLGCLLV